MSEPELIEVESGNRFERWKLPLLAGGFCFFIFAVLLRIGLNYLYSSQAAIQFEDAATSSAALNTTIKVDIEGAVERPDVYVLDTDSRVQDLLLAAGGLSVKADRMWVAKNVNLAAKLTDGAKIYIPVSGETLEKIGPSISTIKGLTTNTSNTIININNASEAELDTLPGIGEVTVRKIISGRPFQKTAELLDKKIVNKSTWEKIKDRISTF